MQKIKDLAIAGASAIVIVTIIGSLSFVFADDVYALFSKFFQQELKMQPPQDIQKHEALSNIRRNSYLLFFALFASGLAIWARIAQQIQIHQTKEQIKNSLVMNRNDRYAKAVEMLEEEDSLLVSYKSGLYILRDLIEEGDKSESLRYSEAIADWLESGRCPPELMKLATDIIG